MDFIFEPRLTCRGKNAPDDSAQPHQELPQRHVLFGDGHHQRAGVVLHKDARDAVTARRVVYHPLLENPTGRTQLLGGTGSAWGTRRCAARGNRWAPCGVLAALLTRSVTENWCVSADILCETNLVGTTVMKYWYIWLSTGKDVNRIRSFGLRFRGL